MTNDNVFPARLRTLRAEKSMSQGDLAKAVGWAQTSVSRWEKGDTDPPTLAIRAIARLFQVSSDWLIGLIDERQGGLANRWIIDVELVERALAGQKVTGTWAVAVPERYRVLSAVEYAAVVAELEQAGKRAPEKASKKRNR